jgi:hypothetical protein
MFRSSTIIRELVLRLAKVMLEHSVNYVLIGYVVVWEQTCEFVYLPAQETMCMRHAICYHTTG